MCDNNQCEEEPTIRSFWPSRTPIEYCARCAEKAKDVSDVMGFYLHQEPLVPSKEKADDQTS